MSLIAPAPRYAQLAGRTPALDRYTQWRLPFAARALAAAAAHAATDRTPVAVASRAAAGHVAPGFGDDWYHQIHVVPATLGLGNLLSTQTRQVEVWNAFFSTQHLGAIDADNAGGIDLNAAPNTDYPPLKSRLYAVQISLDGPPAIDATYTFEFGLAAPTVRITGRRVVVLAYPPNWAEPVTETAEWRTDVLTAVDTSEQRVRLRGAPRESVAYQIATTGTDVARLDGLLWGWQGRAYAVPVWIDAAPLGRALAAGAQSIALPIGHARFVAGGLAIVYTDAATYEAREIATVDGDSITLKKPLSRAWPATARLAPARLGRLGQQVQIDRPAAAVATAQLQFDYVDRVTPDAAELGATTYRGDPVLLRQPNRRDSLTETYARVLNVIDPGTGLRTYDDLSDQAIDRQSWSYLAADRDAVADLRAFRAARAGQLVAFWAPSWRRDLEIVKAIGPAATAITVTDIGYRRFLVGRSGRQDIALLHRDGTWYLRRVTTAAAVTGEPGHEQLSIDSALGISATPTDWRLVCFLTRWRCDADALKLTHHSRDVAELALPMRSVA